MKKRFVWLALLIACSAAPATAAEQRTFANWGEIIQEMDLLLNRSYEAYFRKEVDKAKDLVNDAYFGYYEKEGVERTVMAYISGKRASIVEYQFAAVKNLMTGERPNSEVRASLDSLIRMLHEDADLLDGRQEGFLESFAASLLIILREGVEAILVIAAMAAYLIRSGNQAMVRTVYGSAAAAVLASVAAAFAMQKIFSVSGASQEILEGASMLLATVVLFLVSNWMFAKAEAEAWKEYIARQVRSAVESGSAFALGAAAFLAVFREGAETILFYQGMLAGREGDASPIWLGFGTGCVALAAIFALVRYGSLKIPLRPFFLGTSVLMYIMAVAFAGGGIKELQEGDVIGVTPVDFVQTIDILGVYPTLETLLPQAVLVALALASVIYYRNRARRAYSA
ncbi:MAG: FTR1 family iron permease [Deltaproteobacteria bacterium]|jgi:high-affinity iron transporter|nr:FTR1 family iron permease [Deltaproteobacteria bacterium]